MKKFFRFLFKSFAAVLAFLIITLVVLVFAGITVNLDFMRRGVEVAASKALDRDVSIRGPVELEFSNWPALDISDVVVSNVDGGSSPYLLNAGFARMQLGIFPLLKGEIDIADITAKNVTLNLESDAAGNPNWAFGAPDKAAPENATKVDGAANQDVQELQQGSEKKRIHFTALDHLSLTNISVNYHDAALNKSLSFVLETLQGAAAEGEAIDLKLYGRVQDKEYNLVLDGDSITDLLDKGTPWGFETSGEIFGKQVGGKGNMLLSGEQPVVDLALGARDIDVGAVLAALGLVEGMQASLGDVGIDITVTGDSLQEVLSKSSLVFVVKEGNWKVAIPNTDASFHINSLDGKIAVEEGNNISMVLDGAIEEVPMKLLITGAPLVEYVTNQEELPMSIDAEILESKFSFDSLIQLPISSTDMTFSLDVSIQKLNRFNELLNLDLPPIGPVSLGSKLDIQPQAYDLSALNIKVGESSLDGSFKLDLSQDKPRLDIALLSEHLQFDDFSKGRPEQASETTADEGDGQAEPDAENEELAEQSQEREGKSVLSYEVLNAFDADISVAASEVLSGEDKLGSANVKLAISNANLLVEPITLEVPGGRFDASIDYTPSPTDLALKVKADIEEFDLGVLVRRQKPDSDMGGKLYLDVDLNATAPDLASIMSNANGHLDFGLVPENFSAGIIDLWAVNLLSAIMDKSTEKDQSEMNCVVLRTRLEGGVMEEEAIYLDTTNMRIAGKLDIDFNTHDLEIKLAPKPKRPEFFSVAVPIQVKGTFEDFGLKIGVVRMAGQVVSFITSPIHVPIRRVFTEDSPEDGVEACTYAWTVTAEKSE